MAPMFGSSAMTLPSPFAHDHRPLRSESARSQPTGECKYLLLHPATPSQRCSCQSFHHNRSTPGNICDCGHQACYHVHGETQNDKSVSADTVNAVLDKLNSVFDKVRRLEETIQNERGNRETAFQRERQMWEREVRVLREALAPFYQSEKEMRRRLFDIEDRVDGNYDEQVRLRDRVIAVDDSTLSIEKRVEDLEGLGYKRRRVSRVPMLDSAQQNGYASSSDPDNFRPLPSSMDERSVRTPSSRALSPTGIAPAPTVEVEEPRSSGILNLVAEMPRPLRPVNAVPPRVSPPQEEPRSSGFLHLERLGPKSVPTPTPTNPFSDQAAQIARHQAARITPPQDRPSPAISVKSNPESSRAIIPTTPPRVSGKLPGIDVLVLPCDASPRKRKHDLHRAALEVLADVTAASPHIH